MQQSELSQRRQRRMLRVKNVSESVRPLVAEGFRVRQFADPEGITDNDDGAISHAFFFFSFGAEAEVRRMNFLNALSTESESGKSARRSGERTRRFRLRP